MLFKHTLGFGKFFAPDNGTSGGGSGADADGDGADNDAGNDDAGSGDEKPDDDTAGLKSALDKERKAARDAAKRAKALEDELNQLKNAGKSEEERREADLKAAQEKADAAQQRLHDANAKFAVTDAATKANAISVKAVYALIRSEIEFDDDGEPTNVDELIAAARKDEPDLFRKSGGSGDGGKGDSTNDREVAPGLERLTAGYAKNSKARR